MPRIRVTPGNPQLDLFGPKPDADPLRPKSLEEMIAIVKAAPPTEIEQYAKAQGWAEPSIDVMATVRVGSVAIATTPEPVRMRRVRVPRAEATQAPVVEADRPVQANVARPIEQRVEGEPWSYFTKSKQLSAEEASRVVRGRTLGYVGVRFHKTGATLCRTCHEGMIAGTDKFVPIGFEGQGYQATVYSSEQRKANVMSRCAVCSNDVIGEVSGG